MTSQHSIIADGRNTLELSPQQGEAIDRIEDWYARSNKQVFYLAGLGGTGKTTLVVALQAVLDNVQYCSLTGKAASVLRARGAKNACTLHSLLYGAPEVRKHKGREELVWYRREGKLLVDLIVADECSMIDHKLGRDLLATGVKILVTGDPVQLPPVLGEPFFNKPDFTLTEIHRQAANSQPLKLATAIRTGERIKPRRFNLDALLDHDIVIAALNRTRRNINQLMRRSFGITDEYPVVGERIVGLRNNSATGILNGTLWTIEALTRDDLRLNVDLVDDIGNVAQVEAHADGFLLRQLDLNEREYEGLDLFDFGYCLTCHKAQGSEWDSVVVIDETDSPGFAMITGNLSQSEFRTRWLYTAVTRAKSRVSLMGVPS